MKCQDAARRGHIDVLQCLRDNGCLSLPKEGLYDDKGPFLQFGKWRVKSADGESSVSFHYKNSDGVWQNAIPLIII